MAHHGKEAQDRKKLVSFPFEDLIFYGEPNYSHDKGTKEYFGKVKLASQVAQW